MTTFWQAEEKRRQAPRYTTSEQPLCDQDMRLLSILAYQGDLSLDVPGCETCGAAWGEPCDAHCPEADPYGQHWPPM